MIQSGTDIMDTPPPYNKQAVSVYSGLFIALGLGAVALLILTIVRDPVLQSVVNWTPTEADPEAPSLLLAFLSRLGIVLPTLQLLAGFAFFMLGIRLRQGHILTARWAQLSLLWLSMGALMLMFVNLFNVARNAADQGVALAYSQLAPVQIPLLMAVTLFYAWFWLSRNIENAFHGQETLAKQQNRAAWYLLIPSLFVVIFVAARPLEQTFIRSLTDKRFGSAEVPTFVGTDNYNRLLNIRIDTVSCRVDDSTGGCETRDDGSIRWALIDNTLLQEGYRTAWTIPLPDSGELRYALVLSGVDRDFLESVATTLIFAVSSVTLELIIGLFIAMVVNSNFAGRGIMRAVMLIPWAIPTVISARLWELILKDTSAGIVNRVLMDLSLIDAPQAWLSDPSLQLPAAIMVDVWKTSPFMALLLLAGLQTIPSDLYEASAVDGAGRVRRFFSITLPLLRPTIAVALIFRMLDALRMFDLFNVLFGRQQLSMATYNYEVLVNNQQDGYASAVSMIIFVLIGAFALIYIRIMSVEAD